MDSIKVQFTVKGMAAQSLRMAIEMSGQKATELAKNATMSEVRKWIKVSPTGDFNLSFLPDSENTQVSSTGDLEPLPRVRGQVDDNLLSKDNSLEETCGSEKKHSPQHQFFQGFIGTINNRKFPERISKTIKDKWDAIVESGLTSRELGEAYNTYVNECKLDDSKFCHPNSWISDKGWENESKEVANEPVGHYDF